ncbi:MAG: FtsH protease activity modulator HflK, partial [Planctomycetota bacterium]
IHYALPWPIDSVYTPDTKKARRIEVGFRHLGELFVEPRRSDVLTGDENILKIMMVVQYKIADPAKYLFGTDEPHWLVERSIESAMNQSIAGLPVDDVLTTAKNQIQIETIAMAQALLDAYDAGIILLGGTLQEVSPPVPVLAAFNDVASAKKDSERMGDEAREDKSKITLSADGQARQMISEAQAYYAERVAVAKGDADRFLKLFAEYCDAKEVTRTRLYVDAMERIFTNTKLIILDEAAASRSKITVVEQAGG